MFSQIDFEVFFLLVAMTIRILQALKLLNKFERGPLKDISFED